MLVITIVIGKLQIDLEKTLSLSGRFKPLSKKQGYVILLEKEVFMVKKEENPITKLFIPKADKMVSLEIIVARARGPVRVRR